MQTYRVDKQNDRTRRSKKEEETIAEKGNGKHKEEEQERDKIAKNGAWPGSRKKEKEEERKQKR